jgi:predicted HD superfamily hydrolase involved in NAD metabolism
MTIDGVVHKRYYHSLEVAKMAVELSKVHHLNIDLEKVYLAGLLHDATKLINKDEQKKMLYCLGYHDDDEIMKSTNVWHGETATLYVKNEYNIDDEEILNAIKYHVMGRPLMTDLEKIVFISDYVEKTRVGKTFEIARELAFKDLDKALVYILESQINYITSQNEHLISNTLRTYEYYKKENRP